VEDVMSQSDELSLAATFPPADLAQWRRLALSALQKSGAASEETPAERVVDLLSTTTYEGIRVAPLYTAETAVPDAGVPGLAPFTRGRQPLGVVSGGWDVRQRHTHPDPSAANEAVRADLGNGVTSLWLVLGAGGPRPSALPEVLAEVPLDRVGVVLDAGAQTREAAQALFDLAATRQADPRALTGCLGADPVATRVRTGLSADLGIVADLGTRCRDGYPGLRAAVVDATAYHDAGGSDADELGCALATGVAYLRALTEAGLDVETALGQLEFRYAASADQFLTIAKFRAARRLWARVAEACGADGAGAQVQHAVTSSAMMTARDPWVNMLRTTVACFAAGVGGADAITVQPFDACLGLPDAFSRRIARNTQALLLDEVNLARVIDPAGGSWYVERLTEELARAAWTWFTEIEGAGGILTALGSGLVGGRLDATWEARVKRIRRRRAPITGVSEFPNLTEELPRREPAPEATGDPELPVRRYASVFEVYRDAADAHLRATGTAPTVFLATIGPVAVHTARATFAANLFAAGGIATVTCGAGGDAEEIARAFADSGLRVACLCSSDRVYAERATEVATALAGAGASRVWLAGKGEYGGVDSYLYAGCDAAEVIETTLRDLEVGTK
jgi:methylmalonyl-CoA mutase